MTSVLSSTASILSVGVGHRCVIDLRPEHRLWFERFIVDNGLFDGLGVPLSVRAFLSDSVVPSFVLSFGELEVHAVSAKSKRGSDFELEDVE